MTLPIHYQAYAHDAWPACGVHPLSYDSSAVWDQVTCPECLKHQPTPSAVPDRCPFTNGDLVEVHDLTDIEQYYLRIGNGAVLRVNDRATLYPHHKGVRGWYIWAEDDHKPLSRSFLHLDRHLRKVEGKPIQNGKPLPLSAPLR